MQTDRSLPDVTRYTRFVCLGSGGCDYCRFVVEKCGIVMMIERGSRATNLSLSNSSRYRSQERRNWSYRDIIQCL